ncbi:MAG: acetoacetate decarboxylase family protein [Povalibacter sp.]
MNALTTRYPPPPWTLCGEAVVALRLVPVREIRERVPSSLQVISVFPGRTLGMLAMIRYGAGSTLQYHELIVAPALVATGPRVGSWISHIYVDSEASMLGGRTEWNLPKQLAEFSWNPGARMSMNATDVSIEIELNRSRSLSVPIPLLAPAFGTLGDSIKWFVAKGHGQICRAQGRVRESGALQTLGFNDTANLYWLQQFRGSIPAAHRIGSRR